MKILINAIIAKMGGIQVIINSFIENISKDSNDEYHFLIYKGSLYEGLLERLPRNIYIHETLVGDLNLVKKFFWYQYFLPKYIRENKFDYMINLSNYGPRRPGCKEILLLHNSIHVSKEIRMNLYIKNKVELIFKDYVFKISLKGVHKLVVQTNYMKVGVMKRFKVPEDRIVIIPSTPGRIDNNNLDLILENKIKEFIKNEVNVISNITLYGKHKNLERLLKAVKYIKENSKIKFKLLLTIDEKENKDACDFLNIISDYKIEDFVMSVGNVKHKNIYQILNKSKVFVFPSYAESFGIPFIEAMRFSIPIIAADLGFAHDVCGEAAVYFKYDDSIDLARTIINVLTNNELLSNLKKESLNRSDLYNDKNVVESYFDLIKEKKIEKI